MLIVNPTFAYSDPALAETGLRTIDWENDPVVLFSNSKPNATELLQALRERVKAQVGLRNVEVVHKGNAAQPAPPEIIDQIVSRHRAGIVALGD